jgi:hypothetical protein
VWSNQNVGKNLIAEVERETRIGFDFMLLGVDIDMEKIESRLPDVINQCVSQKKIKPKTINIVVKGVGIVIQKLHEITLDYSDCGVKFNITRILDTSQTKADCVDAVMKKCKNQYCGVFNLCDNVPSNLLCVLNNLINVKLKNINMVEPFHGFSGLIIQPSLYNLFGGNKNMRIVDKITEAAKIQNKEKNIYKWEDLWTPE